MDGRAKVLIWITATMGTLTVAVSVVSILEGDALGAAVTGFAAGFNVAALYALCRLAMR